MNRPAKRGATGRDGYASYAAVIFDMDGVVTDTAGVHAAAWKALFDEVLPKVAPPGSQPPFDQVEDYRSFVDGRTREDGVRSFLHARGIDLGEGTPDDAADLVTVNGLAARKQQLFTEQLARGGVHVFASSVRLLRELRARNVPTALVTSSRNSRSVLDAGGITDLFTVCVDGTDAARLSLRGKPDPAMFWEAARRLSVDPGEAVVVEDAAAGVHAAATGGFALVVGVDRTGNGQALLTAGADLVVADLAGLDLTVPHPRAGSCEQQDWCGGASEAHGSWLLTYDRFDPAQEGTRETLCALGNGYWATRASVPGTVSDPVHYPGSYLAGVYNRARSDLEHHIVETEHRVNVPDWTFVSVRAGGGPVLLPGCAEMLEHRQELDLRRGVLTRTNRYRDAAGRTTRVTTRQFQSLPQPHLAALEMTVEAEDWSGEVQVRSAVNGHVANTNVAADRQLTSEHLSVLRGIEVDADTVLLEVVTKQSGIGIAVAARTTVRGGDAAVLKRRPVLADPVAPGHELTLRVDRGRPVTMDKVAVIVSSRDRAVSTAALSAGEAIIRSASVEELLSAQVQAWERLWERFEVQLQAGHRQSLALNVHTFHVLQSVAAATPDLDAGVPARGLHGEGYRGHIFWDELFVYPMLTLRRPELTRALLLYRYRRLGEARAAARAAGLAGAMFPWQSGSDGREETPAELLNVRTGRWMPDHSRRQHHVGLAVAYSVWQYYQATGDVAFLTQYGAEVLVDVARLFASLAVHDSADDRYDIAGVMGPDEFHDGYPATAGQGLRNNAYTNVLTSWVLSRATAAVHLVAAHDADPLRQRLDVDGEELLAWDQISRRLRVPFHADGIISQFEGYEQLREFDWDAYRSRYASIERLDLILQAEGDSTNNYRLSKQADVLMLFYLLSAEELRAVLHRLGYALPPDLVPRTIDFYLARTSHGSTLSRLAHSWVLARSDRSRSWSLFTEALESDLSDTQGGTTREGIHLGAMAGTVDMALRCYAGVETRQDVLWLHPVLPPQLPGLSFQLSYRGQPISVGITRDRITLHLHPCSARPTRVCIDGVKTTLRPGETYEMTLTT